MTVIAAVATPDGVTMGCDTATDYSGTAIYKAQGKIGTLMTPGEKVLIAAAGSAGILPTIMRTLDVGSAPRLDDDRAAQSWADHLAERITNILADANPPLINVADGDNAATLDGNVLLAWRHHLWFIHTHGAIQPYSGIAAIGAGTDVALGSLHTSVRAGTAPREAVDLAVRLSCLYATGCAIDDRGPILHSTVQGQT